MKNILIFNPTRYNDEIWLPTLWSQAKTYYEMHGQKRNEWNWVPPLINMYGDDYESIKKLILENKPDIFAIGMYVWNANIALSIAKWVKETFPECLIISGGPHQDIEFNTAWFIEHPFLDASVPGANYGEINFTEILDSFNDGKVDWNQVSGAKYPAGESRMFMSSQKTMSRSTKKSFDYQWPSYAHQKNEILDFIAYQKEHFPNSQLLGIFETTRGCPYGCTYCDWGGGTSANVIQKDPAIIDLDLDFISQLNLRYLYIADANFGIFGERDVNIIKSLLSHRQKYNSKMKLGYGGFAKTKNRLKYIKEILNTDISNGLSNSKEIKVSIQSLDQTVLTNIKRKNIDIDDQLDAFESIIEENQVPLYIELILGLPGMDLEKFYHEFNVIGEKKLSIMWFDWLLLPETPAYNPAYQTEFKLKSIVKETGWHAKETGALREIVVGTSSYSTTDYLQMLISTGMYHAIIQGGFFNKSINWITKHYNIQIGDIVKDMFNNFYSVSQHLDEWDEIMNNPNIPCYFSAGEYSTYGGWYMVMLSLLNHNNFNTNFSNWIKEFYNVPWHLRTYDRFNILRANNENELEHVLDRFRNYTMSDHAMTKLSF